MIKSYLAVKTKLTNIIEVMATLDLVYPLYVPIIALLPETHTLNGRLQLYKDILIVTRNDTNNLFVDIEVEVDEMITYYNGLQTINELNNFTSIFLVDFIAPIVKLYGVTQAWLQFEPNAETKIFNPENNSAVFDYNIFLTTQLLQKWEFPIIDAKTEKTTIEGAYLLLNFTGKIDYKGFSLFSGVINAVDTIMSNVIFHDCNITLSGNCTLSGFSCRNTQLTINNNAKIKLLDYLPNKYKNLDAYFQEVHNPEISVADTVQFTDYNDQSINF